MRKSFQVAAVLAVMLLVGFAVHRSMAQGSSALYCTDTTQYDYNHDGVFSKADLYTFMSVTKANGCLYAEATGDCSQYDLDGNQVVSDEDVAVAHAAFMNCLPVNTAKGR